MAQPKVPNALDDESLSWFARDVRQLFIPGPLGAYNIVTKLAADISVPTTAIFSAPLSWQEVVRAIVIGAGGQMRLDFQGIVNRANNDSAFLRFNFQYSTVPSPVSADWINITTESDHLTVLPVVGTIIPMAWTHTFMAKSLTRYNIRVAASYNVAPAGAPQQIVVINPRLLVSGNLAETT